MKADPGWKLCKGAVNWSEWLFVAAETVGGVAPRAHAFLNDANDATARQAWGHGSRWLHELTATISHPLRSFHSGCNV